MRQAVSPRNRLVVGECPGFLFQAVDARIFRPDPYITVYIGTDIADYFSFHRILPVPGIMHMERAERGIVVEAVLVETNPDAVLPVSAECRDEMAR